MSEQPPLTPPSGPTPSFEPYDAPAYGDVAADGADRTGGPGGYDAPTATGPVPPPGPATPGAPGWSPYPVSPQGAPYQMAPQYLGQAGAPTHPLATTALVLGIIGIVSLVLTPFLLVTFVGVVCSPFAIWLGVRARREIRANPLSYSGEGLAVGGFVTGIVGVVLGILALIAILAFVAFIAAIFSAGA